MASVVTQVPNPATVDAVHARRKPGQSCRRFCDRPTPPADMHTFYQLIASVEPNANASTNAASRSSRSKVRSNAPKPVGRT
jgi:hypothetical protein